MTSNGILYTEGEHPDHVVVIKYVPYVVGPDRYCSPRHRIKVTTSLIPDFYQRNIRTKI